MIGIETVIAFAIMGLIMGFLGGLLIGRENRKDIEKKVLQARGVAVAALDLAARVLQSAVGAKP